MSVEEVRQWVVTLGGLLTASAGVIGLLVARQSTVKRLQERLATAIELQKSLRDNGLNGAASEMAAAIARDTRRYRRRIGAKPVLSSPTLTFLGAVTGVLTLGLLGVTAWSLATVQLDYSKLDLIDAAGFVLFVVVGVLSAVLLRAAQIVRLDSDD